jgi:hypothetical protein
MREIFWLGVVVAVSILISVTWSGDEIFSDQEYRSYLERVDRGEGLR